MKTRSLIAACLVCSSLLSLPIAADANSPLRFRLPRSNRPRVTIGAGTRQNCVVGNQKMTALLPEGQFGLTTTVQPSLMAYIPSNRGTKLRVTLAEDGKRSVPVQSFTLPSSAGIVRLKLDDPKMPMMKLGKQYVWRLELICEKAVTFEGETYMEPTVEAYIEGGIERIQPDPALQDQLKKATPNQLPRLYAEAGIWYEALVSLHELRRENPHNSNLNIDWESLLNSAGLSNLSKAPMAECCKVQR